LTLTESYLRCQPDSIPTHSRLHIQRPVRLL